MRRIACLFLLLLLTQLSMAQPDARVPPHSGSHRLLLEVVVILILVTGYFYFFIYRKPKKK